MLAGLFWVVVGVLGLIGIAMLVAGWEMARRHRHTPGLPQPMRVHSIDLNLADVATRPPLAGPADSASLPADTDTRRRALAIAIERMSEPVRPSTVKETWEDTLPRVSQPTVERTPPG